MTIQITKTETKDIEVPVPSFWKADLLFTEYTAILNEHTAIHFQTSCDYTTLQHGEPGEMNEYLETAHRTFDLCTETEFMEAYNKTLKSLSLQPELV
jgi:hypothetical protein